MSYVTVVNGKKLTPEELAARRADHADRFATNMSDIIRCRKAPKSDTDDDYLRGRGSLLQQFDGEERALQAHLEHCAEHGFKPRENDVYLPTLAQFPGDPRAHVRSRAEAQKYAEELGVGLQINGRDVVKHREPESDPWDECTPLGEDLIRKSAPDMVKSDPKLAKDPQQLREAVIAKHALK